MWNSNKKELKKPEILNTMERKSHLKSKVPKDKFKPLREREPESTGALTSKKIYKENWTAKNGKPKPGPKLPALQSSGEYG